MWKYSVIILMAVLPWAAMAQISGTVKGVEDGKLEPLPGANVYWKGTQTGTTTDSLGRYNIETTAESNTLVVSFVGFETQSKIVISRKGTMDFRLAPKGYEIADVKVVGRAEATTVDLKKAELTHKIDDKELRKAACCNLSESFETNATVDVSFTDAVTGTRQIEMLGLAGKYALIQRENIPFARGLNANTGLTFIPGPFVESIQLTKGLSSVLNGYESISGQINVELYKPETAPRLYFNAFANRGGRMELNAISAFDVTPGLSSSVMAHVSSIPFAQDRNSDGFADIPTGEQFNFTNRWHWRNEESGWSGQIGINAIRNDRAGGQMGFVENENPADSLWGYDSRGNRVEVFGKNGYVFENQPYRSFGFIYSLSYQDREAQFGERHYRGSQTGAYLNTIYQDIFGTTQHKYRTGFSLLAENVTEDLSFIPTEVELYQHERDEIVPGAYFEYTYEPGQRFTMVAGLRADYNSYFEQLFVTPRLNLRYMPTEMTTLRIGGGRGQRTPNVIAENLGILASSRTMNFTGVRSILPEVGWNVGASIDQDVPVGERKIDFTVDAFYTWFETKLVTDLDFDRQTAYFTLPEGSESLSILAQADYEPFERFETRLAYKYLDARDQFLNGADQSYLIPKHRAFANLAYSTANNWKFDFTVNWYGSRRLPNSGAAPAEYQRSSRSPDFVTLNAQINKAFGNGMELYAGVNNLLNFRQENPIVSAANPAGPYFDSNYTWGPIFGRNIYAGLYYRLGERE